MRLYFLRHGLAENRGVWSGADEDRPLTNGGEVQMRAEARGMRRLKLGVDRVLSSPLIRAQQTADIVAQRLKVEVLGAPELSPGCSLPRLALALATYAPVHPDLASGILVVGHEPDFSTLVAELISSSGQSSIDFKKGALCRVDLDVAQDGFGWDAEHLRGAGTLAWLLTPKQMARIGKKAASQ
jgi:phosphohistidine phosphatase